MTYEFILTALDALAANDWILQFTHIARKITESELLGGIGRLKASFAEAGHVCGLECFFDYITLYRELRERT